MLRTILLVTGSSSEQAVLSALLTEHHPGLILRGAMTAEDLAEIAEGNLADARLIAFNAAIALPAAIIGALGHGAYAFDAAGRGSALAYAHLAPQDAGFAPNGNTPLSYPRLAYLFWCLAEDLATRPAPLQGPVIDLVSITPPAIGDGGFAPPWSSPSSSRTPTEKGRSHRLLC
jgi:hypothetical protein